MLAARHGRRSVIITTNLAFSEWPKVFGSDEKLTTALFDRLAEHATVITTKGKSFRMRRRGAADSSTAGAGSEAPASQTTPATKDKEAKDSKDQKDGKKR